MKRHFAIDLCAGAGGLSLGLHESGFDVLGVERDGDAWRTHRENVGPCRLADIFDYHHYDKAVLVGGGIPCQPFSLAGKGEGMGRKDGTAFRELIRIGQESSADVLLIENVRGLLARKHGESPVIEVIQEAMRAAGYWPTYTVLDAADFGVPQHRDRLFVVAFRHLEALIEFRWPEATHGPGLLPWVSVRQALNLGGGQFAHGLPEGAASWQGMRSLNVDEPATAVGAFSRPEKLNPLDSPSPCIMASEQRGALNFGSRGAKTKPRRATDILNPALALLDRPASTVSAGGTAAGGAEPFPNQAYRDGLQAELAEAGILDRPATTVDTHLKVARAGRSGRAGESQQVGAVRLTVEQLAILQDFPPGFSFHGNATSQHRQVGNAVPPRLAEAVGRQIHAALVASKVFR